MASALSFNVLDAPEKPVVGDRPRPFGLPMAWDPMTSTLIYGENDAVLVDPLTTVSEAETLAAWVTCQGCRCADAIGIGHCSRRRRLER
ncbi:hypothetical protein SAMN04487916_1075 [Arthrobacter sp. ov407]|nr:hypothetical protein SAMN04487916_1075 [Arthrobacter sp. ov407]